MLPRPPPLRALWYSFVCACLWWRCGLPTLLWAAEHHYTEAGEGAAAGGEGEGSGGGVVHAEASGGPASGGDTGAGDGGGDTGAGTGGGGEAGAEGGGGEDAPTTLNGVPMPSWFGKRVFFRISPFIGESDIIQHFSQFGKVLNVYVPTRQTGQPRGIAYVTFGTKGECERCLACKDHLLRGEWG
jgi:hypothetical protein